VSRSAAAIPIASFLLGLAFIGTGAQAASFDGSLIAGNGDATGGMRGLEGSGWQALDLPNDAVTAAISADGSRVGAPPSPVPSLAAPFRVAAGLTLLALGMRAAKRGRGR